MTYKGHIENGKVVFDEPAELADGTPVHIQIVTRPDDASPAQSQPTEGRSLAERLAPVIGTAEGLPEDAAENVDHYLYGTPKNQ